MVNYTHVKFRFALKIFDKNLHYTFITIMKVSSKEVHYRIAIQEVKTDDIKYTVEYVVSVSSVFIHVSFMRMHCESH